MKEKLRLLTVGALRELAQKHLSGRAARLKTKSELVSALAAFFATNPAAAQSALPSAAPAVSTRAPAVAAKVPPEEELEPVALESLTSVLPDAASDAPGTHPEVLPVPELDEPAELSAAAAAAVKGPAQADDEDGTEDVEVHAPPLEEPLEGLADGITPDPDHRSQLSLQERINARPPTATGYAAADAPALARPPSRSEAIVEPVKTTPPPMKAHVPSQGELDLLAESLGELPTTYDDDRLVLLTRDPRTLWTYWDVGAQSARQARSGLSQPQPVLRLYDGDVVVREVEIALVARSWYLYNVTPNRPYRVELHFRDDKSAVDRTLMTSNVSRPPPEGPSRLIADRFVKVPLSMPIAEAHDLISPPRRVPPTPQSPPSVLAQPTPVDAPPLAIALASQSTAAADDRSFAFPILDGLTGDDLPIATTAADLGIDSFPTWLLGAQTASSGGAVHAAPQLIRERVQDPYAPTRSLGETGETRRLLGSSEYAVERWTLAGDDSDRWGVRERWTSSRPA